MNEIYFWNIVCGRFYLVDQIINTKSHILEIINNSDFLFTRSESKYITFYDLDDFQEKSLDNEEKVFTMCLFKNCLITCDIKNDIR